MNGLLLEASNGGVRLYSGDGKQRQIVCSLYRRRKIIVGLATRWGFGLTIHRGGGFSICGVPCTGGTSFLWGATRERVRREGRDHRAIELGPVGIYIGADF